MSLNLPTQPQSLMTDYRFSIKNRFEVLMIFAILGTFKSSVYRKCFFFSLFLARNSLLACIDKLPTLSVSFHIFPPVFPKRLIHNIVYYDT